MQKEQLMIGTHPEMEGGIRSPKAEPIEKLKKRLYKKDNELKELKKETRDLITELDCAYKELRKTQEKLIIKEKLSVAGRLAAGVAHEIRILSILSECRFNTYTASSIREISGENLLKQLWIR